jgi:choline kinase
MAAASLRQQLDNLATAFGDQAKITVVVGFRPDQIMAAVPDVRFAFNDRYEQTITSKSLLKALRGTCSGGVLSLNGDVVFDPDLLLEIASAIAEDRTFGCVNTSAVGDEE